MIRPLPLRADLPPDDATVVLRAGLMADESVRRSATRTFEIYGVFGLSIEAVIGRSVAEACQTSERVANYRQVRLSNCGRLRRRDPKPGPSVAWLAFDEGTEGICRANAP